MTRSTTRRGWTRAAALALTAGVVVVLTPSAGSAAPASAADARQAVTDTGQKLSALDEQLNQAVASAAEQEAAAAVAATAAAAAQTQLDALEPSSGRSPRPAWSAPRAAGWRPS